MDSVGNQEIIEEQHYPSIMNRIQALFLDVWLILGVLMYISSTFFSQYQDRYVGIKIILFFVVLLIYEPIGNITGGTLGYRTMGMKIRCYGNLEKKVGFSQALMRTCIKLSLGWISFLTISLDPHRRAMHDKASGTVVINSKTELN